MAKEQTWEGGEEVQSTWFKFNQVGDKVKGTLIEKRLHKATDAAFPDQWIYVLNTEENGPVNVGIPVKKIGTIQRLNSCKLGQIIGIMFESEGESAIKGGQKAKNLKVFNFGMDETYHPEGEVTEDVEF